MTADWWTCGVLSLLSEHVFDASWLYVPDGSSYLGSWCFTYYMVLISPCGLIDIYYWMTSLCFTFRQSLNTSIYTGTSSQYFPSLVILESQLLP